MWRWIQYWIQGSLVSFVKRGINSPPKKLFTMLYSYTIQMENQVEKKKKIEMEEILQSKYLYMLSI